MTVTLLVLVSTAKASLPPPVFGMLTSVKPNVLIVNSVSVKPGRDRAPTYTG